MLLTFISMSFGRTKIVLTADGQSVDLRELVRVDESGEVVGLDLPPRAGMSVLFFSCVPPPSP